MSDRNSMDDWQLQESPDSGDQWQLLDQEQNLAENLQLQEAPAGAEQWRPVAYEETPSRRTGWILPSMIILALLAVLGYIGWLAINGFDIGVPASPPPVTEPAEGGESEPGVVAVATQTEAPPTATAVTADGHAATGTNGHAHGGYGGPASCHDTQYLWPQCPS